MRAFILVFHRWTGLGLGLLIAMIGATGAVMAFREHLVPVERHAMVTFPDCHVHAPIDTLIAKGRAVHPGVSVDRVVETLADEPAIVMFNDKEMVYLNPCTAELLGEANRYGGFFGTAEKLHRFKFLPNNDLWAGSIVLAFLVVSLIGGIVLWWPRNRRAARAAIKLNPKLTGRGRTLNLHTVVGIYAALVLVFSAVTGIPMGLKWAHSLLSAAVGSAPTPHAPRPSVVQAGATPLPYELLWTKAHAVVANASTHTELKLQKKAAAPALFEIVERGAPHEEAQSQVFVDRYTGDVLRYTPWAQRTSGERAYGWTRALHLAMVGGLAVQLLLFAGAVSAVVLVYTGFSAYLRKRFRKPVTAAAPLRVKVVRKAAEALDIASFELADPSGALLPAFSAGSHIDVHLPSGITRQYSLCNDPREKHRYLIGVLRDPTSRGGSQGLHDAVNEGDLIDISVPKNHFPLVHAAGHSVLVAGGIGITPILCMAERLANSGASFELHYCARSEERAAFVERIRQAPFANRVTFHFGSGPNATGRPDLAALLARPGRDTHLYTCGPAGFMDAVLQAAAERGWAEANVHREYFAAAHAPDAANDTPFDVKIASTGRTLHVAPGQSVSHVLAAAGIEVAVSCEQGVCGTCVTRVLAGTPEHRDVFLTPAERQANDQFTPCCSRAKSAVLVLDL